METYARHVIVQRWPRFPDETDVPLRPTQSVATLREAVGIADRLNADAPEGVTYQVWDIEHLHLGDMLTADECAETVARFRRLEEAGI